MRNSLNTLALHSAKTARAVVFPPEGAPFLLTSVKMQRILLHQCLNSGTLTEVHCVEKIFLEILVLATF